MGSGPRIAIFAPDPLVAVIVEGRPDGADEIHLHPAGQGVWAARMAAELGAEPVLCGFAGGEAGAFLRCLLPSAELRLVASNQPTGTYVVDRRGSREIIAQAFAGPHTRHEVDELVSTACAAALGADVLVVCNPFPAETLPDAVYAELVEDVRGSGTKVLVDLSTPRLDAALEGRPDLVKINDWELAEYVYGPVDGPLLREGAERILARGAGTVVITRGAAPAVAFAGDRAIEVIPPVFERGHREGCGDAMMGAMAVALGRGDGLTAALRLGAAAGAANFLRRGLGTASSAVVTELAERVVVQPYAESALAAG